jgi:hypothetical protein
MEGALGRDEGGEGDYCVEVGVGDDIGGSGMVLWFRCGPKGRLVWSGTWRGFEGEIYW